MDKTLRISRADHDRIYALAAAAPHVEVCGLLLGRHEQVEEVRPCANVHPAPRHFFEIDPAALIAAYRAERAGGPGLLGWYHSHPGGNPAPSAQDAEDAAPDGRVWIITDGYVLTAWRAVRDGAVHGRFDPLPLDVGGACA